MNTALFTVCLILIGLVIFDLAALRFGVDSRRLERVHPNAPDRSGREWW